ncbi:MAG: tetratricopeptide repeat protein [Candidatus Marinimicrobia bacterium]|nr:tetratricopeptide repeat protein [Candidatus Neomarinimicrobiota bacterium]
MLKPKKKILKKEIKKDPVLEKISQVEHYVRDKGKFLSYVLLAALVILVLSIAMIRSKSKANQEAAGELGIAEMALAVGDVENAIVQFEALIDKNPGTKSAGMATLMLASSYMSKDDFENAEINYRKYIYDYGDDDMFVAAAYNGLGVCLERIGEQQQAAEYFEIGGKKSPYVFLKYECYFNAARNYISVKNIEKAESVLKKIPAEELDAKYKTDYDVLNAKVKVLKG